MFSPPFGKGLSQLGMSAAVVYSTLLLLELTMRGEDSNECLNAARGPIVEPQLTAHGP